MMNDLKYVMYDENQLAKRVAELGEEITRDYEGKDLVMVCILKGSTVFFADLIRQVKLPMNIEFMTASSYGSATVSSGTVTVKSDLDEKIRGKDVLLVEDIVDSGRTLKFVRDDMSSKGVASIRIATLLNKPERRVTDVKVEYTGFVIPDEFVVGYGLDYDQAYRNLPVVGVLKPEIYTK